MNSVILLPEELLDGGIAQVLGQRALYLFETHELKEGLEVKASLLGDKCGTAFVRKASREEIELELKLTHAAPPRAKIILIVAVPRPQTIKKVIQFAATAGVEELHFIKTLNVEKSYLQSKALLPEVIQHELIKGLEQTCDSIPPKIEIHRSYRQFSSAVLPELCARHESSARFIAHTKVMAGEERIKIQCGQEAIFSFGPESGWTEKELSDFEVQGFQSLSLGDRILRVDTAVIYAVSRVEYERGRSSERRITK